MIQNAPYVSAPYIIDDGCCNPIVEENSYLNGTTSSFTVPSGASNNTAGRWQNGALARSRNRNNSNTGVRQAQNFSSNSNNGPWASSQVRTASAIQPNSSDQLLSSTADATPRTWARYGHEPNYGRIRGRLEYSKASGLWKIRYIPIDGSTDSFGGSVVINKRQRGQKFSARRFCRSTRKPQQHARRRTIVCSKLPHRRYSPPCEVMNAKCDCCLKRPARFLFPGETRAYGE